MNNDIDAIELLLQDHRTINGCVEQLDSTDDPDEIRALYVRIVDELAAHEAAEQEVVFPAFRAVVGTAEERTLDHRIGEHEEMNEMLAEMRELAPEGHGFIKRGSALLLEIKGHFEREEESVFARIREALSAHGSAQLAGRILEVKQRVRSVAAGP